MAARWCGVPLLTTWYKGFREQNVFKRLYNSVMARGERVVAVSDQIAELIVERYGRRGRPHRGRAGEHRRGALRSGRGVDGPHRHDAPRAGASPPDTKVILVVGRMLRRKGHHVAVKAVHRLKERGLKDFVCVFAGEDQGRTHYTGELWDLMQRDRDCRRSPARGRRRRHAGCLRGGHRRGLGRRAAGRAAARDPRSAGDGPASRRVRPRGRSGGRAGAAHGRRGAHDGPAGSRRRRRGTGGRPHPLVFIDRCGAGRDGNTRPGLGRDPIRPRQHRPGHARALCRGRPQSRRAHDAAAPYCARKSPFP